MVGIYRVLSEVIFYSRVYTNNFIKAIAKEWNGIRFPFCIDARSNKKQAPLLDLCFKTRYLGLKFNTIFKRAAAETCLVLRGASRKFRKSGRRSPIPVPGAR